MASPQTRNGFTRIANEILEALIRLKILGVPATVVLWIISKSWSWHRKLTPPYAIREIAKELGMQNSSVHKAARTLLEANVICRTEKSEWGIQKNWEHWLKTEPRQALLFTAREGVGRAPKCPPERTNLSTKVDGYKEKEKKDILHSRHVHHSGQPATHSLIQIITAYYEAREWPTPKKNLRQAFGPHWKYAQGLLASADGDVKLTVQAVKDIVPWCEKNLKDWTLQAVQGRYPEWSKERTDDEKEKIRAGK